MDAAVVSDSDESAENEGPYRSGKATGRAVNLQNLLGQKMEEGRGIE